MQNLIIRIGKEPDYHPQVTSKMQQFKNRIAKKLIEFAADDRKRILSAFITAICIYLCIIVFASTIRTPTVRRAGTDLSVQLSNAGSAQIESSRAGAADGASQKVGPAGEAEAAHAGGWDDYRAELLAQIYRHRHYPPEAVENGITGDVRLHFTLQPDGMVSSISVVESPHPLLARASIAAVRRSSPFPPSLSKKQMEFEVTISFALDENSR